MKRLFSRFVIMTCLLLAGLNLLVLTPLAAPNRVSAAWSMRRSAFLCSDPVSIASASGPIGCTIVMAARNGLVLAGNNFQIATCRLSLGEGVMA